MITAFGAAYAHAILSFRILITSGLVVFPSSLIGHAIFAYGEQKQFTIFALTSAFLNVGLNFAFIPIFGIEGAALSTIFTQLVVNILIWKKMKELNGFTILPRLRSYFKI